MNRTEPLSPTIQHQGMGLRDLLNQLFRDWRLCLALFLGILLLGVIAGLSRGTLYKAEARLLVLPSREYVINQDVGVNPSSLSMSSAEFVLSEAEFFKNNDIMKKALERVGLERIYPKIASRLENVHLSRLQRLILEFKAWYREETFETLKLGELDRQRIRFWDAAILSGEKNLSVQTVKDANVILLGFTHKDPEIAALILDNLIRVFQDYRRDVYTQQRSNVLKIQRDRFAQRLGDKESALAEFKLANHFSEFKDQKSLWVRQRAELEANRVDAAVRLHETEARLEAIRRQRASLPREVVEYQEKITEDSASAARVTLVGLEARRNELLTKFTPQSRFVKDLDEQIAALRETIRASTPSASRHQRLARNPVLQELESEEATRSVDQAALRERTEFLAAEIARIDTRLERFDRLENTYNTLVLERDLLEDNLKTYSQRVEETLILEEMDRQKMDNIRLIESPRPPGKGTNFLLIFTVLSSVGGLFAALAGTLLKSSLSQVFLCPVELEKELDLPVLLSIPFKAPRVKRNAPS